MPKKMSTSFLYLTVLLILLILSLAFFARSSFFSIRQVQIEGINRIPLNEIQRLAGEAQGENLFLYDQERIKRKLFLHPLVKDVKFKRQLPNTLVISVSERTPVALVIVPQGVIEVDAQGMFLRRHESWPGTGYPVINGINVPDTAGPGQKLSIPALESALILLGQAPEGLKPLIGELYVNPIQQITIYLTTGVEVRLGQAKDWTEKLKALYQLLNDPEYKSFEKSVRYIDFTAAKPVIGR